MVPTVLDGTRRNLPRNPETRLPEADNYRATLHRSALAHVEDASVSSYGAPPSGFEPHYQIALPYFGLFAYGVGRRQWLLDPNNSLFVSPGWEFQDEHPVEGLGHAAILVNPASTDSKSTLSSGVCGSSASTT